MINYLKKFIKKLPRPDGVSLSWPPSINFPLKKDKGQNNLKHFEELIEKAKWKKELVAHKTTWLCEENNIFQIEIGDYGGEWQEKWAKAYPDVNASSYPVYLKINSVTIKELTFISCDGGRIFVPLPELQSNGKQTVYIWKKNSLPYKVCQIIGDYYVYKNIEGIARVSKISII